MVDPVACELLGRPIYWYGILVAIGFLAALYYSRHPIEIIRIDQGGLIFYGGFLAATAGVIGMARARRLPIWKLGDFTVSALPLGHAFGRVGCLLNGCCYGVPCELPWAVQTAGALRHPVQAYEALFNLALYFVLRRVLLRGARPGMVVAMYLLAYGMWRFTIEFFRGDARMDGWAGLNAAQSLCVALIVAGGVLAHRLRAQPAA